MSAIFMSKRASQVTYSLLAVFLLCFGSFLIHAFCTGTSAFPSGYEAAGRFLVEDHGKTYELTKAQFYTSYILGISMVTAVVLNIAALMYFYAKNEIREANRA